MTIAPAGQGDSKGLKYEEITDFTAGIYDASAIVASTPSSAPGPFPAPKGAADASATWQCIALNQGGLGPLPQMVATHTLTDLGITTEPPGGTVDAYLVGILDSLVTSEDEFLICIEWVDGGGTNHFYAYSAVLGTATAHQIFTSTGTGLGRPAGCAFPFATRVAPSDPTTTVGEVVIVFPANASGDLLLYPDPSAPTAFGVKDISDPPTVVAGTIFGHQTRIVVLQNVALPWPVTPTLFSNNDAINYTDPPNSETFPGATPSIIFVAEEPYGYGAVGSISAGELFMVKCRGGGVVVSGDINNPTVIYLPGVHPTGIIYGRTDSHVPGLFYCSDKHGAWVWNGGNTAAKISLQLDDNFFVCANAIPNQNFSYFIQKWGDWMLFSNNYLYNVNTGGWWRLLDPATASIYWWVPGYNNDQMYGAIPPLPSVTTDFLYKFDQTVPASSWQWKSLPIRVSEDRNVDLREVVVRYSAPYGGSGDDTITVSAFDDFGNEVTAPVLTFVAADQPEPAMQRFQIRCQSEDITVQVACAGGQYAPVVHSISLGFRERQHAGTTQ